jgi:hypothetical protein
MAIRQVKASPPLNEPTNRKGYIDSGSHRSFTDFPGLILATSAHSTVDFFIMQGLIMHKSIHSRIMHRGKCVPDTMRYEKVYCSVVPSYAAKEEEIGGGLT